MTHFELIFIYGTRQRLKSYFLIQILKWNEFLNGLKYESEPITIFVQKLFVFYDDLGAYINTKTSGYLKNTQLFN